MQQIRTVSVLSLFIAVLATGAGVMGIVSNQGPGAFEHESVRGKTVVIYGKGIYRHMSAEVAVQGIAQDYVTVFVAVPLLLAALFFTMKGSLKAKFVFAGTLGYFLVTYLFYTTMGAFNSLFLVYVSLLGLSFFAFSITMLSFTPRTVPPVFSEKTPTLFLGIFLVLNASAVALLWLSIVVPPLVQGTIYPAQLEHYTTLIVQGLDLALLLPLSALTGILLMGKTPFGFMLGPVYYVFLSLLMLALTAKIIAMGMAGYSIIPVIFIIPTFAAVSIIGSIVLIVNVKVK